MLFPQDLVYNVGSMDTGLSAISVECSTPGRTVGLGSGAGLMSIDSTELGKTTAAGMLIGGLPQSPSLAVGMVAPYSACTCPAYDQPYLLCHLVCPPTLPVPMDC